MSTEPDSAAPAHVTDHAPVAALRLGRSFFKATAVRALLTSYVTELQALEDALWALYTDTLDTAEGVRLDVLGRVVGQVRGTLDDSPYRVLLRAVVAANRSNGTGEDVLRVTSLLLGSDAFTLTELRAATMVVESLVGVEFPDVAIRVLRRTKAGGVRLQLLAPPPGGPWFTFAEDLVLEDDATEGFGDSTDAGVGGELIGVYE